MTRSQEPALLSKVRRAASELGLGDGRLVLAVSGGGDSVAMMLAFASLAAELRLKLEVATIDHGLHPASASDARFVARLAERLGLPSRIERVRVGREGGVEAAARRSRYAALRRLARGAPVATAHTLEDQAETVLLRLARGAGTRGLRGILARRGPFVRPMLAVSRSEVRAFLRAQKVRTREDPTNFSARFARNRVRARVLPALVEALGPSVAAGLARAASVAADDERLLESLSRRKAARILSTRADGAVQGDVAALLRLPAALRRRVLRRAARAAGARLDASQVAALLEALESPHPYRRALTEEVEFSARYGGFAFGPKRPAPGRPFERPIEGEGRFAFPEGTVEVTAVRGPGSAREGSVRLDPKELVLPLVLRSRRPGDRFRPRGGGGKKLKEFLIDRKVPREQRDALRLLCDGAGRVLWVVGIAESDAAARGERARRAWQVRVSTPPSAGNATSLEPARWKGARAGARRKEAARTRPFRGAK